MAEATPQLLLARQLHHVSARLLGLAQDPGPEPVHAARVALRRLRTILAGLAPATRRTEHTRLRQELKWIAARLGTLRDADIRCAVLLPLLEPARGTGAHLTPQARLATLLRIDQRRARQLLRVVVASRDFACRLRTLQQIVADARSFKTRCNAGKLLRHALRKRLGKLKRMLQVRHSSSQERHALRIQIKKCRYLLEACDPASDCSRAARTIAQLHNLQDCLGELNDIAQVRRWLVHQQPDPDPDQLLQDSLRTVHSRLLSRHRRLRTRITPRDIRCLKEKYA